MSHITRLHSLAALPLASFPLNTNYICCLALEGSRHFGSGRRDNGSTACLSSRRNGRTCWASLVAPPGERGHQVGGDVSQMSATQTQLAQETSALGLVVLACCHLRAASFSPSASDSLSRVFANQPDSMIGLPARTPIQRHSRIESCRSISSVCVRWFPITTN